jgi:hypothetical protein
MTILTSSPLAGEDHYCLALAWSGGVIPLPPWWGKVGMGGRSRASLRCCDSPPPRPPPSRGRDPSSALPHHDRHLLVVAEDTDSPTTSTATNCVRMGHFRCFRDVAPWLVCGCRRQRDHPFHPHPNPPPSRGRAGTLGTSWQHTYPCWPQGRGRGRGRVTRQSIAES